MNGITRKVIILCTALKHLVAEIPSKQLRILCIAMSSTLLKHQRQQIPTRPIHLLRQTLIVCKRHQMSDHLLDRIRMQTQIPRKLCIRLQQIDQRLNRIQLDLIVGAKRLIYNPQNPLILHNRRTLNICHFVVCFFLLFLFERHQIRRIDEQSICSIKREHLRHIHILNALFFSRSFSLIPVPVSVLRTFCLLVLDKPVQNAVIIWISR
mmetsp:Transcript_6659/g.10928  ORF Transcript_6659/g.10928 Transcript_6659/m.10928 type:complete len:209 (+) Transcript_6659:168-794(+)